MNPPTQLTGEDFVQALQLLDPLPGLYVEQLDWYGKPKPIIQYSGLLPYQTEKTNLTIDALVWDDGLILVSRRIFEALGGKVPVYGKRHL
jgi:hypothetical protein